MPRTAGPRRAPWPCRANSFQLRLAAASPCSARNWTCRPGRPPGRWSSRSTALSTLSEDCMSIGRQHEVRSLERVGGDLSEPRRRVDEHEVVADRHVVEAHVEHRPPRRATTRAGARSYMRARWRSSEPRSAWFAATSSSLPGTMTCGLNCRPRSRPRARGRAPSSGAATRRPRRAGSSPRRAAGRGRGPAPGLPGARARGRGARSRPSSRRRPSAPATRSVLPRASPTGCALSMRRPRASSDSPAIFARRSLPSRAG